MTLASVHHPSVHQHFQTSSPRKLIIGCPFVSNSVCLSVRNRQISLCFSSPKAHGSANHIPMTLASVHHPSVHQHFQSSSPRKQLGKMNSIFIWRLRSVLCLLCHCAPRLAKCWQINIFAMPVAFTGKYREILANNGKYWQI